MFFPACFLPEGEGGLAFDQKRLEGSGGRINIAVCRFVGQNLADDRAGQRLCRMADHRDAKKLKPALIVESKEGNVLRNRQLQLLKDLVGHITQRRRDGKYGGGLPGKDRPSDIVKALFFVLPCQIVEREGRGELKFRIGTFVSGDTIDAADHEDIPVSEGKQMARPQTGSQIIVKRKAGNVVIGIGNQLDKRIWHIDIPAILPTIVIMLIMAIGNILSIGYEKVYLLQNGMNLEVSEIISTYVFKTGIRSAQYSFATAVGLFNSVINLILLVAANFIAKKTTEISLF